MTQDKLYWDCDTCNRVERANKDETYGEVQEGDREPCIYCDGVAYVRRHKNARKASK